MDKLKRELLFIVKEIGILNACVISDLDVVEDIIIMTIEVKIIKNKIRIIYNPTIKNTYKINFFNIITINLEPEYEILRKDLRNLFYNIEKFPKFSKYIFILFFLEFIRKYLNKGLVSDFKYEKNDYYNFLFKYKINKEINKLPNKMKQKIQKYIINNKIF